MHSRLLGRGTLRAEIQQLPTNGPPMRNVNRGDVPVPHVNYGAGKRNTEPAEELVFDAGSLSFVQDWVNVESRHEARAAEPELERVDPRQSNPNKRLGVGAKPKQQRREQAEPSALEKKLARKRQRQERSAAIASEVGNHGIVDGDVEENDESKTALFKKMKNDEASNREAKSPSAGKIAAGKTAVDGAESSGRKGDGMGLIPASAGAAAANDQEEALGEGQTLKRKARRKKRKASATPAHREDAGAAVSRGALHGDIDDRAAETLKESDSPQERDIGSEQQVKKQRRGWGTSRSKLAASMSTGAIADATSAAQGIETERRKRKTTRSRQKNIRKDNRPSERRPAHLRLGDSQYSGRGLTAETRRALGLPPDESNAPPAGWGKADKPKTSARHVAHKDSAKIRNPVSLADQGVVPASKRGDVERDEGMSVEVKHLTRREGEPTKLGKSKYKNLNLCRVGTSTGRAVGGRSAH